MKLAIMQPYLFPYIGYWQLINAADKFVVLDDVNYINKGWINRNRILLNNQDHLFTLPLRNASQNRLIKDIELDDISSWKNKFVKTLEMAYKKAPEFSLVMSLVVDCLDFSSKNLSEFVTNSIKKVCDYLSIKTELMETSSGYGTKILKGEEKIISICKKEKAGMYINPFGGRDIYSKQNFHNEGIELFFIKTGELSYTQFNNIFIPHLSIIDVMMFNSINKIKESLRTFTII